METDKPGGEFTLYKANVSHVTVLNDYLFTCPGHCLPMVTVVTIFQFIIACTCC